MTRQLSARRSWIRLGGSRGAATERRRGRRCQCHLSRVSYLTEAGVSVTSTAKTSVGDIIHTGWWPEVSVSSVRMLGVCVSRQ